jgi:NAD(P)H-hydrate epimerase
MNTEQQIEEVTKQVIQNIFPNHVFVTPEILKKVFKKRVKYSHKGSYGHAWVCAGSYGKIGAAVLAVGATLRSGAGLVTACVPACGYEILQTTNPEAMVTVSGENNLSQLPDITNFDAVAIGPGIGVNDETENFFMNLLNQKIPSLLIDADALNILSKHPKYLEQLPNYCILTPHEGEFKRLVGEWSDERHKFELLKTLSARSNAVVILKGPNTTTVTPAGELFINTTGNSGMAKGGSGDVLTGILAALLAQKYTATDAAILGVYVHGLAGDLAKKELGETGMKAGDIVQNLPHAFRCFE